jgi:hypothetical protein
MEMGRQVNFYITSSDEVGLLDFLRESDAIVAYPFLAERRHQRMSKAEMFQIFPRYLTSQYGLSLSRFSPKLNYRALPEQPSLPKARWALDSANSEVIEYDRCVVVQAEGAKPIINRGRFWVADAMDSGETKDREFVAWSASVLSKARAKLKKFRSLTYIGDEAMRLHASSKIDLR